MPKKRKKKRSAKTPNQKSILVVICLIIIILSLTVFNISYLHSIKSENKVLGVQIDAYKEIEDWTNFMNTHPNYLEGWIELTKIEYNLGDFNSAKQYISKARLIDPNSEDVKTLEDQLRL